MRPQITAVVLTQNEADNIVRCLKSISWCQEIILIDDSTDKTIVKAQNLNILQLKIYQNQTKDDFAYLRNKALKLAKNEWVLFIDADEEVTPELHREIKWQILNTQADGFYIPRRDYFLGRWLKYGETGKIKLLKLGRKGAGKWVRAVHEVWQIKNTAVLKNTLRHYPHPTISEFLARIQRWSTLDAQVFYKQGIRSNFGKILVYPVGKFILNYIFRLGFLDGMPGLIMALFMSFHSFLTRAKLYFYTHHSPAVGYIREASASL